MQLDLILMFATFVTGLWTGAALYVSIVENPAHLNCSPLVAREHFSRMIMRASYMQGTLFLLSQISAFYVGIFYEDDNTQLVLIGALVMLGGIVPVTVMFEIPINIMLKDPKIDLTKKQITKIIQNWGIYHHLRTFSGMVGFYIFANCLRNMQVKNR